MGGICGIVFRDAQRQDAWRLLRPMAHVLSHRGPTLAWCDLGQAALAVRRRTDARERLVQPVSDAAGRLTAVFDGEVPPSQKLDGLAGALGPHGVALWNAAERTLLLARDRFGMRPLYYAADDGGLLFASEIKAFLEYPGFVARLSASNFSEYVRYRYMRDYSTLFEGIYEVPPATVVEYRPETGRLSLAPYWSLPQSTLDLPRERCRSSLRELFDRSVARCLEPMSSPGALLSGGVDSSWAVARATHQLGRSLPTFTVGYDAPRRGEQRLAETASSVLHSHQHTLVIDESTYADTLERMTWHNDEPIHHANAPSLYHLASAAGSAVDGLLAGEGACTMFGGVAAYRLMDWQARWPLATRAAGRICAAAARTLPSRRLRRLGELLSQDVSHAVPRYSGYLYEAQAHALGLSHDRTQPVQIHGGAIQEAMAWEAAHYLVNELNRLDKTVQAAGLETYCPYLDPDLVEFAAALPDAYRLTGRHAKALLKETAASDVGRALAYRRKLGFPTPTNAWLAGQGAMGQLLDVVVEPRAVSRGLFDAGCVRRMIAQHRAGKGDHGEVLLALLNFELWARVFIDHPQPNRAFVAPPAVSVVVAA